MLVTDHHARLGTRLRARLCRGRHLRRLDSMSFQGATLTEPDVSLSTYPARATHRRLPPSAETKRVPSAEQLTHRLVPTRVTCSLRSTGITPAHRYYEAVRPCFGASVLSASRCFRLCLFPYHRQTGSQVPLPKPRLESRLLYTGHRMASK